MATKVGWKGRVVGVDLSPGMMEVGKKKLAAMQQPSDFPGLAEISFCEADIASGKLLDVGAIKEVLDNYGGFDVISVCSALVLLDDQAKAVKFWADKLLKQGGRMIIDVPTEELNLLFLMSYHLPLAIGLPESNLSKGRLWIKGQEGEGSLKALFEQVGLMVEQNIKTGNRLPVDIWHDRSKETAMRVLESEIENRHSFIKEKGKVEEARKVWPDIWRDALQTNPDGNQAVREAHALYICVGRKP